MTLFEWQREDPVPLGIPQGLIIKLSCVIIPLFLLLAHVVDANHVAMADQHVHGEGQDLSVKSEVVGDALMDHPSPLCDSLNYFHSAETYSIPPKMMYASNFIFKLTFLRLRTDISSLYELEEELVEVGLDVDALHLGVDVLVDEHEVRVDFEAAIFAKHKRKLIPLVSLRVNFGDRPILYQGRKSQVRVVNLDSQLNELSLLPFAI